MYVCILQEDKDWATNPGHVTPEEYFNPNIDLTGRDVGRPREISTKIQKFKANLWLCENYPLSLPEQVSYIFFQSFAIEIYPIFYTECLCL